MNIVQTNQLTVSQKEEITLLKQCCYAPENLQGDPFLSNEINWDKNIPCFYLGYEDTQLVAFLTTFVPQRAEAEITAFTHPNWRNRGCFLQLYSAAYKVLKQAGTQRVLFVLAPQAKGGKTALQHFKNAEWLRSEYRMYSNTVCKQSPSALFSLQLVTQQSRELLLRLM
ncbi:MAG: GNAT family N-acetyltransferase, partial [Oscillospiraceae bacterium]|nr:GNAT family N-acetyltransferase [Oscillospiraceae bacterium]